VSIALSQKTACFVIRFKTSKTMKIVSERYEPYSYFDDNFRQKFAFDYHYETQSQWKESVWVEYGKIIFSDKRFSLIMFVLNLQKV
jgi:hypothetical protein